MGSVTVWYQINHPEYPQCKEPVSLVSMNLSEQQAEKIAKALFHELRFVTGLDTEIKTWVD